MFEVSGSFRELGRSVHAFGSSGSYASLESSEGGFLGVEEGQAVWSKDGLSIVDA